MTRSASVLPPAAGRLAAGPRCLCLQPLRSEFGSEPLRIGVGQVVLGSAPPSDILLACEGVAGRHCVVQFDGQSAIATILNPLTWLNEGPFREARLKDGDILTLGPVELRVSFESLPQPPPLPAAAVVETPRNGKSAPTAPAAASAATSTGAAAPAGRRSKADDAHHVRPLLDEAEAGRELRRDQLRLERELERHRLRQMTRRPASSSTEPAPLPPQGSDPEPKSPRRSSRSLRDRLRQLRDIEDELATRAETIAAAQREFERQQQRFAQQQRDLDQQLARVARQQSQLDARERELDDHAQGLETRLAEFNSAVEELDRDRVSLHTERDEFQRQVTALTRDLEQRRRKLDAVHQAAEDREAALVKQAAALNETQSAIELRSSEIGRQEQLLAQRTSDIDARARQVAEAERQTRELCDLHEQNQQMFQARQAELEQQTVELQQHLAELDRQTAELRDDQRQLAEQRTALEQERRHWLEAREHEAAERSREHGEREQAFVGRQHQLAVESNELAARRADHERLHSELLARDSALTQAESGLQQRAQEIAAREAELQSHELDLAALKEQLADWRQSLQTQSEELSSRQTALTTAEKDLAVREGELEVRARELEEQAREWAERPVAPATSENSPQPIDDQELQQLAQRLFIQQKQLRSEEERIEALRTELDAVHQQLAAERRELETEQQLQVAEDQRLATLVAALERQRKELTGQYDALLEAQDRFAAEQQAYQRRDAEADATHSQQRQLANELAELRDELDRRSHDLTDRENEVREALSALAEAAAPSEPDHRAETLQLELEHLSRARGELASRLTDVTAERDAFADALQELRGQLQDAEVEHRNITALQQETDSLRRALEASRGREAELQAMLQELEATTRESSDKATSEPTEFQHLDLHDAVGVETSQALLSAMAQRQDTAESTQSSDAESAPATAEEPAAPEATEIRSHLAALFGIAPEVLHAASHRERQSEVTGADRPDVVRSRAALPSADDRDSRFAIMDSEPAPQAVELATTERRTFVPPAVQPEAVAASCAAEARAIEPATLESPDSVAAYMQQLLARVHQPTPQPATPLPEPVESAVDTSEEEPIEAPAPAAVVGLPTPTTARTKRKLDDHEIKEMRANLDSMRQIANYSARTALAQHHSKQLGVMFKVRSALTAFGLLLAIGLLTSEWWGARSYQVQGWGALVVSLLSAGELARTCLRLHRLNRAAQEAERTADQGDASR